MDIIELNEAFAAQALAVTKLRFKRWRRRDKPERRTVPSDILWGFSEQEIVGSAAIEL